MLKNRKKNHLLQVFRGISVILVVLYHLDIICQAKLKQAFLFHAFYFGLSGVDFFFVLSGFIICYVHYSEIGQRSLTRFKSFLIKRFIRIFPTYWIITLLVSIFLLLLPNFKNSNITFEFILKSLILFPQKVTPIIQPAWTLICEVFFYIIFSITILLEPIFYIPITLFFTIGSIIGQIVGNPSIPPHDNEWIGLFFGNLNNEFVLGCLSAFLVIHERVFFKKILLPLGISLFITAGIFVNYIVEDPSYSSRLFWFGIPSFLIITGSAHIDIKNFNAILSLLLYFGDASYSIYLIHGPAISVMSQLALKFRLDSLVYNASLLYLLIGCIAIFFGCLYYTLVEKRLLHFFRGKIV
jgi:exopolysaccharide production protein ExoZ